jgi:peptide/nickel transport system ATP-binding protein
MTTTDWLAADTTATAEQPVAAITNLCVDARTGTRIVNDVSLTLGRGEIVGLVGESGSGKTTTALAFFGYAQHGAQFASGTVRVPDRAPVHLVAGTNVRDLRGRYFSYVPQNPGTALNPIMRVGQLLEEVSDRRCAVDAGFASNVAAVTNEVLGIVDLPTGRDFRRRYPHQLSGGQQQRVCIAMALLSGSKAIVLDEPTTGLDVVTQAAIIDELRRLRDEHEVSMVYISHDLAVVAELTTRVAVMYSGQIVEVGDTADVLHRPRHDYTRTLLDAWPDINRSGAFRDSADHDEAAAPGPQAAPTTPAASATVLDVRQLCITHRVRGVATASVKDIGFTLERGECLALVGESGSGKSTTARAVAGIQHIDSGTIILAGETMPANPADRTAEQRRRLQIIFQNAAQALNPRESVRTAIERARRQASRAHPQTLRPTAELLDLVRLSAAHADKLPRHLSGGQRQRVCIARALAASPDVLVCDEITSALDVSVQASVLKLLGDLRNDLGVALLFITHDLGVVAGIADFVMVLDRGRICEKGPTEQVLHAPQSEYAQRLMAAVPSLT